MCLMDSVAEQMVLCTGATHPPGGTLVPLSQMSKDSRNVTKNGGYRGRCKACINYERRLERNVRARPRDAATLYKAKANMRITRLGAGGPGLKSDHLMAILNHQGFCCYVSGRTFQLPDETAVTTQRSWDKWVNTLPVQQSLRVPELVIHDSQLGWVKGNLVFVCRLWDEAIRTVGGVMQFKEELYYMTNTSPAVATAKYIQDYMDAIEAKRIHEKQIEGADA